MSTSLHICTENLFFFYIKGVNFYLIKNSMGRLNQRIVRTIVKKMQQRQKDHNMFLTWVQMIKVMSKQWTGTRAIRRQIPPSKPKWKTTKITNRKDTTKTKAWSKCMRLNMLVCVWPVWKLNTAFLRGHSKCQPCLNLQRHEKMISSFFFHQFMVLVLSRNERYHTLEKLCNMQLSQNATTQNVDDEKTFFKQGKRTISNWKLATRRFNTVWFNQLCIIK